MLIFWGVHQVVCWAVSCLYCLWSCQPKKTKKTPRLWWGHGHLIGWRDSTRGRNSQRALCMGETSLAFVRGDSRCIALQKFGLHNGLVWILLRAPGFLNGFLTNKKREKEGSDYVALVWDWKNVSMLACFFLWQMFYLDFLPQRVGIGCILWISSNPRDMK